MLRWAALLHDIGKPATRRHEPNGGVSFHHHEVVGAKMVRKRLRALKYSKQMVDDISQLVFLHLRFHGYGDGKWTDSAVRRYVTDAGPLLPRLHKLVRADCTTRNKRRAARLQASYDQLEARIAELAAREDLARVRPDLDGNQIMRAARHPGGPAGRRGVALPEGAAAGARAVEHRGGDRGAAGVVGVAREPVAGSMRRSSRGLLSRRRRRHCGHLARPAQTSTWTVTAGSTRSALDFDGDGLRDDALADFDGDGVVDHAVLDLDNDGTPEATSPTTGRGRGRWPWTGRAGALPSEAGTPPAGGGLRWFGLDGVEHTGGPLVDFDGHGHADDRLIDSDGDGVADRVLCAGENGVTGYVDTDGDGKWDVRLTDTDGDGLADGASTL